MPGSINYQDVLPVAVPAIARRRRFYPANGTTFNAVGSNEIRIELPSTNALLDPQHSYLEFRVRNVSAFGFGADIGGGSVFFEEVSVEQGGRVLARQQAHNRLHSGILSVAQVNDDGQKMESITEVQRGLNDPGGGGANQITPAQGAGALFGDILTNRQHNSNVFMNANSAFLVCMAIPTGLFTQDKLLPLPLVSQSSPLTLVLRLADPAETGVWTGGVAGTGALSIERINVVAQMVEVGGDVIQQFRQMMSMSGGQLSIHSTDIEHSQSVLIAGSPGEQIVRVPIRKRSVKSLLFQINSEDFTNPGGVAEPRENFYNLSFGGNANMLSYQLKVGSVVYPPSPIDCWGRADVIANAHSRGECAMELAKALGTLGFTNPTGRLSSITYGVNNVIAQLAAAATRLSDGDNADGAGAFVAIQEEQVNSVCPFGLDLDSFQHQAIEAGVDSETLAQETNLILNIADAGSGIEDKNVHTYLIYDQHYYFNMDGSITFSN